MSAWAPTWGVENLGMAALCVSSAVLILAALKQYDARRRRAARRRQLQVAASHHMQQQGPLHPPGEPLPVDVRSALQSASFSHSPTTLEDVTCPICLVEYEDREELCTLPCKHTFHKDCVGLWFDSHSTCPLCRFALCTQDPEQGPEEAVTQGVVGAAGGTEEGASQWPQGGTPAPGHVPPSQEQVSSAGAEDHAPSAPLDHRDSTSRDGPVAPLMGAVQERQDPAREHVLQVGPLGANALFSSRAHEVQSSA